MQRRVPAYPICMASLVSLACKTDRSLRPPAAAAGVVVVTLQVVVVAPVVVAGAVAAELSIDLSSLFLTTLPSYVDTINLQYVA